MSRNIVLFALGSRGDIQPCVALGRGLAARGASVRLLASGRYESMITDAGLDLFPMSADPSKILSSEEGQQLLAGGRNPVKLLVGFRRILGPLAERMFAEMLEGSRGADLILAPDAGWPGENLGEHYGVPSAELRYAPGHRTGAFPHPLLPQTRRLGSWGNRRTFDAIDMITWQFVRPFVNPFRTGQLGLDPLPFLGPMRRMREAGRPVLCAVSPAVVPRPRDWPANSHMTGFWFLDEPEYEPPADLADFLDAGRPPVYVGFGSMVPADPVSTYRLVRDGLKQAGVRGVFMGDPDNEETPSTDDLFVLKEAPHSWLFPRMAAVVHHGGAGTTAAGLRAGVPTVICPFFGDQPYWGERVSALKVGPAPIPFRKLTAPALAGAVRRVVHDPVLRARAEKIGERISGEKAIPQTCDLVEALLDTPARY
ncbi:glycosyltransferase [Thermomonospora umbrina]|uniref:UDP:flavonoid glycosyltransferase YjiC (YdhE family) n=1 Tax=Thermomonospora umbrina TaxID=111806 RepID=A0A3D9SM24_9ACTN|nr:glycosyltransferase [Thermomonospora umbrina]REE96972.1 UDP:flavonoid glycosyltransferase YjiC (YdhE family) [Thermomonospora umbrina]